VIELPSKQREAARSPVSPKKSCGHALIADALRHCGVKRVVGITGTPVDQIFSECAARSIRPVGVRHQQTAVLMAATSNYIAGRLDSVVVVSAGPAVTNALTGVLIARDNGWPVIVLGGRRPLHEQGIGYFQELDAVPIYQSVTKSAVTVTRTADLPVALVRAHEIAMNGRPGPVYLDLPEDVLNAHAETDLPAAPHVPAPSHADAHVVAECAQLLRAADRPLLILGEGIRWSFNHADLRNLVEQNGIPFITAPLARGFLPDDHPLCANDVRRWVQSQADVVLLSGAWFDWRFRFGAELAPSARVIHTDIDPATLGKNVPDALTVHADSGRFLSQVNALLQTSVPAAGRLESWRQRVMAAVEQKRLTRAAWLTRESTPMAPQTLFAALRRFLPEDAIVVLDGNITLAAGQALLSAHTPCGWLDPGWNGCMGAGIPMAMGAKLAAPERTVVVVCGDFGFGLSAMDLETAVRHRIPVVVVVANNDGICGGLRQKERLPREHPELFSRFQEALRYERIAEIFGGHSEFVTDATVLGDALDRAAASGLPACLNVRVDPYAPHPGFW
jgi:thiamine pyrophosphate-dependent acetolactate synthase large subunit-like protein